MRRASFFCFLAFVPILEADQGYMLQTIAGSGYPGDNNPATQAFLAQTEGIAIDGLGNIYIADAGDNRVRKISADGVIRDQLRERAWPDSPVTAISQSPPS